MIRRAVAVLLLLVGAAPGEQGLREEQLAEKAGKIWKEWSHVWDGSVTDEEFDRLYRHKVKAFLEPEHAIDFAYHCNLVSVLCQVFDLIDGNWCYNEDATSRLYSQIN